jgi:prepilin-type processing-associated H-X9-DG protein
MALTDYQAVAWVFQTIGGQGWQAGCWEGPVLAGLGYGSHENQPTFKDVMDGLSHTILLIEMGGSPAWFDKGVELDRSGAEFAVPWIGTEAGNLDGVSRVNQTNFYGIFSLHPGGAHVAMADGSVHFLGEGVEPLVISALATRDNGEAIPDKAWR